MKSNIEILIVKKPDTPFDEYRYECECGRTGNWLHTYGMAYINAERHSVTHVDIMRAV